MYEYSKDIKAALGEFREFKCNNLIHTVDKDLISYRSMKEHERLLDSDF